jgi:hypothetical protein
MGYHGSGYEVNKKCRNLRGLAVYLWGVTSLGLGPPGTNIEHGKVRVEYVNKGLSIE